MASIFGRLFLFYFVPILALLEGFFLLFEFDSLICISVLCSLSAIGWKLAYWVFDLVNDEIVTEKNKIVVITGCDTGFGHGLAVRLDRFGFHVFAGVYSLESDGAKQLQMKCSPRMRVVQMDVTKAEQVDAVVEQVRQSGLPLHAIVNNAGILIETPFEWGQDIEVLEKTFDVNVYGVFRVTKAFVDLLRQSKGRIVNVASAAGRITVPTLSHYCMSKHAVRSFSDAIRRELHRFDVKVITIEPAFYKTQILNFERIRSVNRHHYERSSPETRSYYDEDYFEKNKKTHKFVSLVWRDDPEEVVDALEDAVKKVTVKPFIRCCGMFDLFAIWFCGKLPETFTDYILSFVK